MDTVMTKVHNHLHIGGFRNIFAAMYQSIDDRRI